MKAVEFERVQRPSPLWGIDNYTECVLFLVRRRTQSIMADAESFTVYLIINKAGRRYIGLSECILKRIDDHNNGRSTYTAKHRPWKAA
ncbi:MAG: hypothetical protein B9S30_04210 [Verrucomicrobiia bacterium Tous-C5FEB]|nr:MAG: hypothetical protein B9S30_04210 [Verrucomicrobiae bacterium Tous-C5FEB]